MTVRPFAQALAAGDAGSAEAQAIFDALPPMEVEGMRGAWKGEGFASGHPFDGALEAFHWHGKRFESAEHVHPLVFRTLGGGRLSVRPAWLAPGMPLAMRWPWLKSRPVGRLVQLLLPLLATRRSRARLRGVDAGDGRCTAAMVYDDVPILDLFRRVDADTVMGRMDAKGLPQPFFFVLRRERTG